MVISYFDFSFSDDFPSEEERPIYNSETYFSNNESSFEQQPKDVAFHSSYE